MRREDIEKLLGGYATGSLTPAEREALFIAALDDQVLFDKLAREEVLRLALDSPSAKARLLAALDEGQAPWPRGLAAWLGRPVGLAAMAGVAAALATVGVYFGVYFTVRPSPPKPSVVAQMRRDEAVAPPAATVEMKDERAPRANRQPKAPAKADAQPSQTRLPKLGRVEDVATPQSGSAGVVGGVPGGVIGGIVAPPRLDYRSQAAPPPPPPPPPPAIVAPKPEAPAAEAAATAAVARSARADKAREAPGALALFNAAARDSARLEERKEATASPASGVAGGAGIRPRAAQATPPDLRRVAAPAQPPVPHLGLRYTVLRRDPGGAFVETDPGAGFARGDQLRLSFEPNDAGHLYVLQRESGGGWRLLASDRIERRARYQAPRDGALSYEEPGSKQLYAIFSRTPEPSIAALDPQAIEAKLRGSLAAQKSEAVATGGERAVYVVNTSSLLQSQQVALAITLVIR